MPYRDDKYFIINDATILVALSLILTMVFVGVIAFMNVPVKEYLNILMNMWR